MELLSIPDAVLQLHLVTQLSFKTAASLCCTCVTLRNICRQVANEPFVRTLMVKRETAPVQHPPEQPSVDQLSVVELRLLLEGMHVNTSEIEAEAGSEANLRSALEDRYEQFQADEPNQMRADILRARAIMDDLAMPARPNLCFIFASASELGTAKVLAELLPPSIVVFGAVSQRGVIGTTARGSVLEEDKPPDEPLMSVTLVHLPPDTSIHPFFQPRADPHGQSAPMLGALPVSELSGSAGPARDTTLLLLADTADSVSRLMKVVGTPHVRVLGGLTERGDDAASSGSLLLRAPHAGLRAGLQRVDGAIGLYVQGGHACVPAITRGAALLPGQDWTVAVADSTPRSICPGHQVSHHVVRRLAADGSTAHDGTVSPLQALHRLSEEQGGQLPSPLFLALSATPSERRRRLVSPMHVLYQHDGALQVESAVLVGEHCRFASVTPQGSRAELAACVEAARPRFNTDGPMLCLSFVCCGRGAPFHGAPNCETLALRDAFPHMAVAGFFAMGELGPRPFFESGSDREDDATLQGFTAVHAVLQFRAAAVR